MQYVITNAGCGERAGDQDHPDVQGAGEVSCRLPSHGQGNDSSAYGLNNVLRERFWASGRMACIGSIGRGSPWDVMKRCFTMSDTAQPDNAEEGSDAAPTSSDKGRQQSKNADQSKTSRSLGSVAAPPPAAPAAPPSCPRVWNCPVCTFENTPPMVSTML